MNTITIKGRNIGDLKPQICVPIAVENYSKLNNIISTVADSNPDIIEWRSDYFDEVDNKDSVIKCLNVLKSRLIDCPIIFTFRSYKEGGHIKIDDKKRIEIIKNAVRTGFVDIIDIELSSGKEAVSELIEFSHKCNVRVIVSYHNFLNTPDKEDIVKLLVAEQDIGADIAKVAVMPNEIDDAFRLLEASLEFKNQYARIPQIVISMSDIGRISRVAGFLFGSSITYASVIRESAPGQIPIWDLKRSIEKIYNSLIE